MDAIKQTTSRHSEGSERKTVIRPPKPLITPPENRSTYKHCDFHETHGHTTKNCLSLKYFIEKQIGKGNMNQYLERKIPQKGETSNKAKNMVNVVFGGITSPPPSPDSDDDVMIIQYEPFPEQVISFSNKDFEGLDPYHNEALVISLDVADNDVKRIIIDNGSSVNILFHHTLNRM